MSDSVLRKNIIRLASQHPKGSAERKQLLGLVAGFPADSIGDTVSGPTGIPGSDAQKPWSKGEFTQQENEELGKKQESGQVGDGKPDDGPMKVAGLSYDEYVRDYMKLHKKYPLAVPKTPLSKEDWEKSMGKQAGCEKLPEALRENCEKKKDEGGDKEDEGKKASEQKLRSDLIRLAHARPEFRSRILPLLK